MPSAFRRRQPRSRSVEPIFPLSWVVVALVVVGTVSLLFLTLHPNDKTVPAACVPFVQSVDQLSSDLATTRKNAASGPVDMRPLATDTQAIQAQIVANPGPFADHVLPLFDAMSKLLNDVQKKSTNQVPDFIAISSTSLASLQYCGVSSSGALAKPQVVSSSLQS
jgi:hypothetical protein